MKKLLCLMFLLSLGQCTFAGYSTRLETYQDAYDRSSQQNYERYQQNNYQAPLGGYSQSLSEPAGRQYGYNEYQSGGISSPYSNSSYSNNHNLIGF